MVTTLTKVVTSVMLETRSGSESNSIAYMVVVAALGMADTIRITDLMIGSAGTKHINKKMISGDSIIRVPAADKMTCQLNDSDVIDASCIPNITIISGIAALLNMVRVE